VLTAWQKTIDGPMTYTLVAKQWAPTSRNYVRDVSTITDGFYSSYCNGADPNPTQEAKAGKSKVKAKATEVAAATPPADETPAEQPADEAPAKQVSGADIAKRNIEQERNDGGSLKGLGAGMLASTEGADKAPPSAPAQPDKQASAEDSPPVTLLNAKPDTAASDTAAETAAAPESKPTASKADSSKADSKTKSAKQDAKAATKAASSAPDATKGAPVQTASINSAATQLKVPPAKGSGKCKVWTASYGGQRAVIIKASGSGTVNYTVLDVTESNEKREVDAYIAAYAKGGERVGSFATQTKALNKAFELCPEG
jgi:hypothetical protein